MKTQNKLNQTLARGLRLLVSLTLLFGLGWFLDLTEIVSRLKGLQIKWIVLALVISVFQVLASAWRWSFTAKCLGLQLPLSLAVREYYLAMFLNQVVPGGVIGDISRAWRHARDRSRKDAPPGPAVRAVIIERASGQITMMAVATISLVSLPVPLETKIWVVGVGVAMVGLSLLMWMRTRGDVPNSWLGNLWHDTRIALFSRTTFPLQFLSSGVTVATYILTYLVAAQVVGVTIEWTAMLPLVAPVLVAMLIPITVAGWGVRESSAALLWAAVGLNMADGVAVSVAYGLLVFLSTLPGSVIFLSSLDWRISNLSKS